VEKKCDVVGHLIQQEEDLGNVEIKNAGEQSGKDISKSRQNH
jgi:hypothetical protein